MSISAVVWRWLVEDNPNCRGADPSDDIAFADVEAISQQFAGPERIFPFEFRLPFQVVKEFVGPVSCRL